MTIKWAKYKQHSGPKYLGHVRYEPEPPRGPWSKILGVISRCEGNVDTVVMYDATGVTWGFQQWTFKSGRLQRLLEFMKSIPVYDFSFEDSDCEDSADNLFDECFCDTDVIGPNLNFPQKFEKFGFTIHSGKMFDIGKNRFLDPRSKADQRRMDDICSGKAFHKTKKVQKAHATALCQLFADAGEVFGVGEVQAHFAKGEFKRHLKYKRKPLAEFRTIEGLLGEDAFKPHAAPVAALFFCLWQNNPRAAFKLFLRVRRKLGDEATWTSQDYFESAWKATNKSTFGNWGWKGGKNRSPRVIRIKKSIREFYHYELPYYK